jgi:hypothetical protein
MEEKKQKLDLDSQQDKEYGKFLLTSIGYTDNTEKIIKKNKQRAKKLDEQLDFEKAYNAVPTNINFLNSFYRHYQSPVKKLSTKLDERV